MLPIPHLPALLHFAPTYNLPPSSTLGLSPPVSPPLPKQRLSKLQLHPGVHDLLAQCLTSLFHTPPTHNYRVKQNNFLTRASSSPWMSAFPLLTQLQIPAFYFFPKNQLAILSDARVSYSHLS